MWEITGHGLKRPSYLFGTMHVSSKMVFHLSDSFYLDLKSTDIVALELDPRLWQDQLFRYDNMQTNLRFYTQGSPRDYLNIHSFQLEKYEDRLKSALSDEPTLINGLLYRTFQARADFEEDTYLDLYIYQTGMKLGKQATGVENFFQTEQLTMEAAQDMMKDRDKRHRNMDGESMFDVERKSQVAYRTGDLDMLDSLEKLLQPSEAYMEKFLYRRNEIQAASIDSIVRQRSLFVGVGAAHLPGKRGVIELRRRKGYTLRPVAMQDRDGVQKDTIDKIHVPVSFSEFKSDDGAFSVQVPGKLYKRADGRSADSWQYADMANGAYYMVGRVKTHAGFLGQKEGAILKKVDSLLYENIPGKILKRSPVTRDGFVGYDVTSKTRRGDFQRYNIFVTPAEVLVFKMSGNGNYVEGKEADQFFGSIRVREKGPAEWAMFTPPQGGFSIRMPRQPSQSRNAMQTDGIIRWEYEAEDSMTGNSFLVWNKTVQNFHYLEEDTADLALAEESFQSSEWIDRTLSRRTGVYKGFPCLDASYLEKDGSRIRARFVVKGPHYFVLAVHSAGGREKAFPEFFDSFTFSPYRYSGFRSYVDTFMHISVNTPVVPDIDAGMRNIMERASSEDFNSPVSEYNSYWPRMRTALFEDDSTGEAVFVSMETFPKYYCPKDSATFWEDQTNEKRLHKDFLILSKQPFGRGEPVTGYKFILADTNSSRLIHHWTFFRNERLYHMVCMDDSSHPFPTSEFISRFYHSIVPVDSGSASPIFSPKLDIFFKDLHSPDSATRRRAREAIPNVYFGAGGLPRLLQDIAALNSRDKDYFNTKAKLINELGYIDDRSVATQVVTGLRAIYEKAGDTSTFQHAALRALARQKTRQAYDALKVLLVQDPPIFGNSSDYNYLFQDLGDSLALARDLFPELLQLAVVDDYKDNIRSLLSTLVDSGYLKASDYESSFSQLYFDAKIQWKKQEGRDEKKLQKKDGDKDDDIVSADMDVPDESNSELEQYAILLVPFYDRNATVPRFFDKLLQSRDADLRMSTVVLLLRNDKPVADSILVTLAAGDRYRSSLFKRMKAIHKTGRFPAAWNNQLAIARSQLVSKHSNKEVSEIQYVDKRLVQFRQYKGFVYLFKYKLPKEDEWKIGFSGLQPIDPKEVDCSGEGADAFISLTNKSLRSDSPEREQFDKQLHRFLLSRRKSAAVFYMDRDFYAGSNEED
ncbi:MAG: TraB/GumN family protein [Bacteroidota bacterium]|nr:TraB/GumN family protein [Bacteroidota bacterium]